MNKNISIENIELQLPCRIASIVGREFINTEITLTDGVGYAEYEGVCMKVEYPKISDLSDAKLRSIGSYLFGDKTHYNSSDEVKFVECATVFGKVIRITKTEYCEAIDNLKK